MSKFQYFEQKFLDRMRRQGDPLIDAIVAEAHEGKPSVGVPRIYDVLKLIGNKQYGHADVLFFIDQFMPVPSWADFGKAKKAADFFRNHTREILLVLGFKSLPYCYAAADGARALYFSDKIRQQPEKRLLDTATFVMNIFHPKAFSEALPVRAEVLKVRLIHAIARYHIMHDPQWDMKWGLPLNQEDLAGTNLAFSLIVLRGLRELGFILSPEESKDYLHFWSIIAYWLGIDVRLIPDSPKEAFHLEKAISRRNFKTSMEGRALTQSLLYYYEKEYPAKSAIPQPKPQGLMYFFLGYNIADILHIAPASPLSDLLLNPLKSINLLKSSFFVPTESYQEALLHLKEQSDKLSV